MTGFVLICAGTRELDELDACRAKRMGPVDGTFCLRDTTCNFVEEIGGRNGAIERCDELGRERVESLDATRQKNEIKNF